MSEGGRGVVMGKGGPSALHRIRMYDQTVRAVSFPVLHSGAPIHLLLERRGKAGEADKLPVSALRLCTFPHHASIHVPKPRIPVTVTAGAGEGVGRSISAWLVTT